MSPATATLLNRLAGITGAAHCSIDPTELQRYAVDGRAPAAVTHPGTAEEAAEVVRFAATEKLAVVACGGRSKLGVGMAPARYDVAVDTTRLSRVVAYDPGDLTLSVEAGIGISALLNVLAEKNQWLPLYVPWFDRTTLGGILAGNSVSPLRYMFGSPRDYLLGLEFVTGDGQVCKSGSRVVKSVAGYDIHKLLLGSLGTLGILTKANFRTFPLPRAQRAVVAAYRDAGAALQFCRAIVQSPLKPSVVEVLDPGAGGVVRTDKLPQGAWCVVAAAIGHEAVVERHARDLRQLADETGAASFAALEEAGQQVVLGNVREFLRLVQEQHPAAAILRMSVLPTAMPMACQRLREAAASKGMECALVVRAASVLYLAVWPGESLRRLAEGVRAVTEAASVIGPAFIEFCPAELKKEINVWGPASGDFELMQRVKRVFDPQGVLSPGRFVGGL